MTSPSLRTNVSKDAQKSAPRFEVLHPGNNADQELRCLDALEIFLASLNSGTVPNISYLNAQAIPIALAAMIPTTKKYEYLFHYDKLVLALGARQSTTDEPELFEILHSSDAPEGLELYLKHARRWLYEDKLVPRDKVQAAQQAAISIIAEMRSSTDEVFKYTMNEVLNCSSLIKKGVSTIDTKFGTRR